MYGTIKYENIISIYPYEIYIIIDQYVWRMQQNGGGQLRVLWKEICFHWITELIFFNDTSLLYVYNIYKYIHSGIIMHI